MRGGLGTSRGAGVLSWGRAGVEESEAGTARGCSGGRGERARGSGMGIGADDRRVLGSARRSRSARGSGGGSGRGPDAEGGRGDAAGWGDRVAGEGDVGSAGARWDALGPAGAEGAEPWARDVGAGLGWGRCALEVARLAGGGAVGAGSEAAGGRVEGEPGRLDFLRRVAIDVSTNL